MLEQNARTFPAKGMLAGLGARKKHDPKRDAFGSCEDKL
jgi:hypothetical protein